jgi:hypothetical protein
LAEPRIGLDSVRAPDQFIVPGHDLAAPAPRHGHIERIAGAQERIRPVPERFRQQGGVKRLFGNQGRLQKHFGDLLTPQWVAQPPRQGASDFKAGNGGQRDWDPLSRQGVEESSARGGKGVARVGG